MTIQIRESGALRFPALAMRGAAASQVDFAALQAEVVAAREGEASLDAKLDIMETAASATEAEVVAGRGAAASLDARFDMIESEIVTARGGQTTLDARLDAIESEIDGVAGAVPPAEFDALQAEVIAARDGHASLDARLDADFANQQDYDPTLSALAVLNSTPGLVEQTGADAFTKRAIGAATSSSVLTRADGDNRYATNAALDALDDSTTAAIEALQDTQQALQENLETKAPLVHTHLIDDILDLPALSETVLRTTTAEAHRAAIGAASTAVASTTSDGLMSAEDKLEQISLRRSVMNPRSRPGDSPFLFSAQLSGRAELVPTYDDASVVRDSDGRVIEEVGAAIVAMVDPIWVETGRTYLARGVVRRRSNPEDPAGHTMQLAVAWLDSFGMQIGTGVLHDDSAVMTGDGRVVLSGRFASAAGTGIAAVMPAGAIEARVYLRSFGEDGRNHFEFLDVVDLTDALAYSPDLTVLEAEVAALVALDIGPRLEALEAAVDGSVVQSFLTVADAEAATVSTETDLLRIARYDTTTDITDAVYERVASDGDVVTNAGTVHWAYAEPQDARASAFGAKPSLADSHDAIMAALERTGHVVIDEVVATSPIFPPAGSIIEIRGGGALTLIDNPTAVPVLETGRADLYFPPRPCYTPIVVREHGVRIIGNGVIDANREGINKAAYNAAGGDSVADGCGVLVTGTAAAPIAGFVFDGPEIHNALNFGLQLERAIKAHLKMGWVRNSAGIIKLEYTTDCQDVIAPGDAIDADEWRVFPHCVDVFSSTRTHFKLFGGGTQNGRGVAGSTSSSAWYSGLTVVASESTAVDYGYLRKPDFSPALQLGLAISIVNSDISLNAGEFHGFCDKFLELASARNFYVGPVIFDGHWVTGGPNQCGVAAYDNGFYEGNKSRSMMATCDGIFNKTSIRRMRGEAFIINNAARLLIEGCKLQASRAGALLRYSPISTADDFVGKPVRRIEGIEFADCDISNNSIAGIAHENGEYSVRSCRIYNNGQSRILGDRRNGFVPASTAGILVGPKILGDATKSVAVSDTFLGDTQGWTGRGSANPTALRAVSINKPGESEPGQAIRLTNMAYARAMTLSVKGTREASNPRTRISLLPTRLSAAEGAPAAAVGQQWIAGARLRFIASTHGGLILRMTERDIDGNYLASYDSAAFTGTTETEITVAATLTNALTAGVTVGLLNAANINVDIAYDIDFEVIELYLERTGGPGRIRYFPAGARIGVVGSGGLLPGGWTLSTPDETTGEVEVVATEVDNTVIVDLIARVEDVESDEIMIDRDIETFTQGVVAGAGTIQSSGLTVTGTGTAFSTNIDGRYWIEAPIGSGVYRQARQVDSNTVLQLTEAFPTNLPGGTTYQIYRFGVAGVPCQGWGFYSYAGAELLPPAELASRNTFSGHTVGDVLLGTYSVDASGNQIIVPVGGTVVPQLTAAATIDFSTVYGDYIDLVGNTNVSAVAAMPIGTRRIVRVQGTPTFIASANLLTPQGINLPIPSSSVKTRLAFQSVGDGIWELSQLAGIWVGNAAVVPALRVGAADQGVYSDGAEVGLAVGGQKQFRVSASAVQARVASGSGLLQNLQSVSEGAGSLGVFRYQANLGGALITARKARGVIDTPADVILNDDLLHLSASGYSGGAQRDALWIKATCIEPTPSATAMGARASVSVTPLASITPTEVLRLEPATGLSMFGANPVIDASRHHRLRSYTVATLPAASAAAGQIIYCSDETGGAVPVFSDSTAWRRVTDRNIAA